MYLAVPDQPSTYGVRFTIEDFRLHIRVISFQCEREAFGIPSHETAGVLRSFLLAMVLRSRISLPRKDFLIFPCVYHHHPLLCRSSIFIFSFHRFFFLLFTISFPSHLPRFSLPVFLSFQRCADIGVFHFGHHGLSYCDLMRSSVRGK